MKITILAAVVLIGVLHKASSQRDNIFSRIQAVVPPHSVLRIRDPDLSDYRKMCQSLSCHGDAPVCRIIRHWCGHGVSAMCAPCVPQDVDAVCNAKFYMKAILIKGWQLEPLYCDIQDGPNKVKCPLGSECIEDAKNPNFGVCCFDWAVPLMHLTNSVTNEDQKCPTLDKCLPGMKSQNYVSQCGRLQKRCEKAEPKVCKPVNYGSGPNRIYCDPWTSAMKDKCNSDRDCPDDLKCCPSLCSGLSCEEGIDGPVLSVK